MVSVLNEIARVAEFDPCLCGLSEAKNPEGPVSFWEGWKAGCTEDQNLDTLNLVFVKALLTIYLIFRKTRSHAKWKSLKPFARAVRCHLLWCFTGQLLECPILVNFWCVQFVTCDPKFCWKRPEKTMNKFSAGLCSKSITYMTCDRSDQALLSRDFHWGPHAASVPPGWKFSRLAFLSVPGCHPVSPGVTVSRWTFAFPTTGCFRRRPWLACWFVEATDGAGECWRFYHGNPFKRKDGESRCAQPHGHEIWFVLICDFLTPRFSQLLPCYPQTFSSWNGAVSQWKPYCQGACWSAWSSASCVIAWPAKGWLRLRGLKQVESDLKFMANLQSKTMKSVHYFYEKLLIFINLESLAFRPDSKRSDSRSDCWLQMLWEVCSPAWKRWYQLPVFHGLKVKLIFRWYLSNRFLQ